MWQKLLRIASPNIFIIIEEFLENLPPEVETTPCFTPLLHNWKCDRSSRWTHCVFYCVMVFNVKRYFEIGNKLLVYMNYFNFVITHSRNELEKEPWTLTFAVDWDNNGAVENVFETSMTLNSTFTIVFTLRYQRTLKERCLDIQGLQRNCIYRTYWCIYRGYRCCGTQIINWIKWRLSKRTF